MPVAARGQRAPLRDRDLCSGPGKLTQALAISLAENGSSLQAGPIAILPREGRWLEPAVVAGTRIGISRAVELRWRFCAAGEEHVSRPWPAHGRPRRRRARAAALSA